MGPPSFDLIDQPWIPVQRDDSSTAEVSLLQLFSEAGGITRLSGDVPTQEFAILRLLLAVLHRSVGGPASDHEWRRLWRREDLPVGDIAAYLDRFRGRFDLLHPETPFYQVHDLEPAGNANTSLTGFLADMPVGNPYFRMREPETTDRIGFAEAARWLIHCQAFDASGIKSGARGDDRVKGGKGYPVGPGCCGRYGGLYATGDDLRETLLLNLIAAGNEYLTFSDEDSPVWERPPQTAGIEQRPDHDAEWPSGRPRGPLDLYTWQSRRVRLHYDRDGVTGALVCQGDKMPGANMHLTEPFTAWRRSPAQEKKLKVPLLYLPKSHDPRRSLWRGLASLLPDAAGAPGSGSDLYVPGVLQWIGRLSQRDLIPADRTVRIRAVGAHYVNNEAIIEDLIDDSLTVAAAVFDRDRPDLAACIRDAVSDAEAAVRALTAFAAELTRAAGGRDSVDSARAKAADAAYSELDGRFRTWLSRLNTDTDLVKARTAWQKDVHRRVRRLGSDLAAEAGPAAWTGREIDDRLVTGPVAELRFTAKLRQVLPLAQPSEKSSTKEDPSE